MRLQKNKITSKNKPWPVRATMLDLARQRETLASIEDFISFSRDWGYNTLVLYLEGVVRTKHFPYRAAKVSYSPDDMRRVVKMAAKAGLEVVPAIPTLGHVEQFLACRQLKHLAETGSWINNMFCSSNEGTYQFLEKYFSDLVSIFPGKQIHINCDEVWGLGACPVCRERLRNGETREDILIKHIIRMHAMLRKFGKRVWIWDDMFENDDGELLSKLPRDIVLGAWHYSPELMDHDGFPGRFNNLARRKTLRRDARLGFKALVIPWANGVENAVTITRVAREYPVLGGIQTAWELSKLFLPSTFPAFAVAGALWSNPEKEPSLVVNEVLHKLFPHLDAITLQAVRCAFIERFWDNFSINGLMQGNVTLEETRNLQSFLLSRKLLGDALATLPPGRERDIIVELHARLRLQIVAGRLRILLPRLSEPGLYVVDRNFDRTETRECLDELTALAQDRSKTWKRLRPGIGPDHASAHLLGFRDTVKKFIADLAKTPPAARALFKARLFLFDSYGAPSLKIELRVGDRWETLRTGNFKPNNQLSATCNIEIPWQKRGAHPDRLRLTMSGFGGQGVQYAWMVFRDRVLIPGSIESTYGQVQNATAVLTNNSSVCMLGSTDVVDTLHHFSEKEESSVEILLQPEV